MPKAKPKILNDRHNTKEEEQLRDSAESAMKPRTALSLTPPAVLDKNKIAKQTWIRTVGLYNEIDGVIATAFDFDLLVKYCLLEEEVVELAEMRNEMKKDWDEQVKVARKFRPNKEQIKEFVAMWEVVNAMFQKFQSMDARLDGKRKLLYSLSQSLYLTPRSRAGVAPPTKPGEKPKSDMGKVLDE